MDKTVIQLRRNKYYVAVTRDNKHADIITCKNEPTRQEYPQYLYMFGGYLTKKKAVQVANYQGFFL